MRRRCGAYHSDSVEGFIQTATDCQDRNLCFYHSQKKSRPAETVPKCCEFTEQETNSSIDETETEFKLPTKVMVLDNSNVLQQVQHFCGLPETSSECCLEFCHKVTDKHIHFWISNLKNTKYTEVLNVYIRNCDHFVYFYSEELDHEFQEFTERLSMLKTDFTLYKVCSTTLRSKSCDNNPKSSQNTIPITSKTVIEALQTITNRMSL